MSDIDSRHNALHIKRKVTSKTVIILCQRTSGKGEDIKFVLWESFHVFFLLAL